MKSECCAHFYFVARLFQTFKPTLQITHQTLKNQLFFASRGARVTALDNNLNALEETIKYVKSKYVKVDDDGGASIISQLCDVTQPLSIENAINSSVKEFGTPDLLWNNAGYQGEIKPTLDYNIQDFATVMNVNVSGMFCVMQTVARKMANVDTTDSLASTTKNNVNSEDDSVSKSKKYSIVNTASVAGLRGTPGMVAYSASKAAVIAMTVSSAKDLAPFGIRVNAISPALIGPEDGYMWNRQNELHASSGSPYFSNDPKLVAEGKIASVPMKRLGSVEEVLRSVAFLLSDDSSYTTAFNLVVDGGLSGGLH